MTRAYKILIRLYPLDIKVLYGQEMVSTFEAGLNERRQRGRTALARFLFGELIWLLCDAAEEWIVKLSSHPSFRGRCLPDARLVRPPGVGKKEWYYSDDAKPARSIDSDPRTEKSE